MKGHELKEMQKSDYDDRVLVAQKREAVAAALAEPLSGRSVTAFEYVVTLMSRLAGAA